MRVSFVVCQPGQLSISTPGANGCLPVAQVYVRAGSGSDREAAQVTARCSLRRDDDDAVAVHTVDAGVAVELASVSGVLEEDDLAGMAETTIVATEVVGPPADLFFPEQAPTSSTPERIIALTLRRVLDAPAVLALNSDIDLLLGSGCAQAVRDVTEVVRVPNRRRGAVSSSP